MSLVLSTISLFSFTWVHQLRGFEWPTSDPPYYSTLACAVEKSLQLCFKAWKKNGKQQSTSYRPSLDLEYLHGDNRTWRTPEHQWRNKSAVIFDELLRRRQTLPSLQETCLADPGSLKEKDCTFFLHGKSFKDCRKYRVGFAVRNTLPEIVELAVSILLQSTLLAPNSSSLRILPSLTILANFISLAS